LHQSNKEFFTILIDELKNPKNLPLIIPRTECPQNKFGCKKRHKDIVIARYDPNEGFLLQDYSMHSEEFVEAWFSETGTLSFLLGEAKRYNIRKNVKISESRRFRTRDVRVLFSDTEYEKLSNEARSKKVKIVDLIRTKSLI
jgi:hypothetical protein